MDQAETLRLLNDARSGHLATIRPDGAPHVVVVTFAVSGGRIVTAIDEKPKTTDRLQRLANIEANPAVSFLADHYEEDWGKLWWVRVDGAASIHTTGDLRDRAIRALAAKYVQYQATPPKGPVIAVPPDRVTSWSSSG